MARRTGSTKLFIVLSGLMVLLTVASAVAGSDRQQPPEPSKKLTRWATKPHPAGFRAALTSFPRAKDQKAAFRDIARQAILDLAGLSRPSLNLDHEDEDFSVFVPAGDLDGDGKEDAAELFFDRIVGVRGVNGTALWTHQLGGFGGIIGSGPLDGVSGDDLIVVDIAEQELDLGWRWTWTYRGLAGRSGAVLWTRTYENVWTVGGVGNTGFYVDTDFALPYEVADLSGDGRLDLVVGRFNIAEYASPSHEELSVNAVFDVVSGANGTPTAAFPAVGRLAFPDLVVTPDLSSDGVADVVTFNAARSGPGADVSTRIVAQPGKGGAPLWTASATTERQPYGVAVKLNADAFGDLILVEESFGWTSFRALSGQAGQTLWTKEGAKAWVEPVGDVTGDGGSELLLVEEDSWCCFPVVFDAAAKASRVGPADVPALPGHETAAGVPCYDECPSPPPPPCYGEECPPSPCVGEGCTPPPPEDPCEGDGGYGYGYTGVGVASHYGYGYGGGPCNMQHVSVLNGAVGEPLWEADHRGFVEAVGDADGDGIADTLLEGWTLNEEANEWQWSTEILSGRDGGRGWGRVFDADYLYPLREDLDGDGGHDLLLLDFSGSGDRYVPVSGATGQPLWDAPVTNGGWLLDVFTAALRGGPRHDLLETRLDLPSWSTQGRGVAGDTGETLWTR